MNKEPEIFEIIRFEDNDGVEQIGVIQNEVYFSDENPVFSLLGNDLIVESETNGEKLTFEAISDEFVELVCSYPFLFLIYPGHGFLLKCDKKKAV